MRKFTLRWVAVCGALGALLLVYGCSSSSSKSYSLLAKLPAMSQQQRIVMAAIDVTGSTCTVSILTADSGTLWSPDCTVNQDSATHKSFTIGGQQVDMEGASGSFTAKTALTLPLPASTAAPAASAAPATAAKPPAGKAAKTAAVAGASAPAAGSAASAAPATGQPFPDQWGQALYPGNWKLAAQNLGYLVASANIGINGSACELHVVFKVRYPPYNLQCVATTDPQGNFTLIFNPFIVAKKALSPTNQILLASEGQSISGLVWDSHGFDAWNPAVPPSWRVAKTK
ncbi:MAG TPA: hypothetical protein VJS89_06340 [Gammaproteobacteria bacterium]|nr:hypothetical protein [Gammaproteobacteria bacterium]